MFFQVFFTWNIPRSQKGPIVVYSRFFGDTFPNAGKAGSDRRKPDKNQEFIKKLLTLSAEYAIIYVTISIKERNYNHYGKQNSRNRLERIQT